MNMWHCVAHKKKRLPRKSTKTKENASSSEFARAINSRDTVCWRYVATCIFYSSTTRCCMPQTYLIPPNANKYCLNRSLLLITHSAMTLIWLIIWKGLRKSWENTPNKSTLLLAVLNSGGFWAHLVKETPLPGYIHPSSANKDLFVVKRGQQ